MHPFTRQLSTIEENSQLYHNQYIALSYRWGTSGRRFITTRATFQERLNCIPFESLPLTFQHAVETSRKLGVRYLWIDSLCIIQDDNEDWTIESGQMGLIYAHSYVTLAADSGRSSDSGLFNTKSVLHDEVPFGKHVVLSVHPIHGEGTVQALYVSDERNILSNLGPQEMYPVDVDEEDEDPDRMLVTRGWTLQEAVLAPRVLHYTSKQLIWECPMRGYQAEDDFSVNLRYARPTHTEVKSLLQVQSVEREENGSHNKTRRLGDRRVGVLKAWYIELIELRYATRRLTYPEDKLPAIAGLASWTAPTLGSHYVAGMWRSKMEWALAWRSVGSDAGLYSTEEAHPPKTALQAPKQSRLYRGPSFSWVSSYGAVSWDYALETFERTALVEDVHVELDSDSIPFGRVKEGCWITLTGLICQYTIAPSPGWSTFTFDDSGEVTGKVHLDRYLTNAGNNRERRPQVTVMCLELGLGSGPELGLGQRPQGMRRRSCQLVLLPINGKPGSYTRVGFADSWEVGSDDYARYVASRERRTVTIY